MDGNAQWLTALASLAKLKKKKKKASVQALLRESN